MMFGWWTEDMIWISRRILIKSASVSILDFFMVLMATYDKKRGTFWNLNESQMEEVSHLLTRFFVDTELNFAIGSLAKLSTNFKP